jgi:hypothetical protein
VKLYVPLHTTTASSSSTTLVVSGVLAEVLLGPYKQERSVTVGMLNARLVNFRDPVLVAVMVYFTMSPAREMQQQARASERQLSLKDLIFLFHSGGTTAQTDEPVSLVRQGLWGLTPR